MKAKRVALGGVALAIAVGTAWWAWQRLEPLPPPASTEPLPPRVLGFRLNVERTAENAYAFSRSELEAALKDPYQLTHLGRVGAATDGSGIEIVAAPRGSLVQRMGLEAGDVIQSVNGQAVTTPRDLARVDYHAPSLRGRVRRAGRVLELSYTAR